MRRWNKLKPWPSCAKASACRLDIKTDIPAKMRLVTQAVCAKGETIHNMLGGATVDQVYASLIVADEYGQRFLEEWE